MGPITKGGAYALIQSLGALGVFDAIFTGGLISPGIFGSIYLINKYYDSLSNAE